jgi:hypothetical protein
MKGFGFDGRERLEEFPTGRWILAFAAGDIVWWVAWIFVCAQTEASNLSSAIFVGTSFLGRSLYTFDVRLLSALITWTPFLLTAIIAYKFKFGDRSGWPILAWVGAAYVLSFLTRFLVMFVLIA